MDIKDIDHLISIRDYIYITINNPVLERGVVYELQDILAALDLKIIENLRSPEFKEFVGFVEKQRLNKSTSK